MLNVMTIAYYGQLALKLAIICVSCSFSWKVWNGIWSKFQVSMHQQAHTSTIESLRPYPIFFKTLITMKQIQGLLFFASQLLFDTFGGREMAHFLEIKPTPAVKFSDPL